MDDEWLETVQRMHEAQALLRDGDLESAEKIYQEISETKNDARAWYGLSQIAFKRNDSATSVKMLQKAIEIDPKNPQYYGLLGNLYRKLFRLEEAVEVLKKGIALDPSIGLDLMYQVLGIVLMKLNRFDEAFKALKTAIELDPYSEVTCHNLGVVLEMLKQHANATSLFRKALDVNPLHVKSRISLALNLQYFGDYEESLQEYKNCLNYDPDNVIAYLESKLSFPVVYENVKDIETVKAQWPKKAKEVYENIRVDSPEWIAKGLEAIFLHSEFYAGYIGGNVRSIFEDYSRIVEKLSHAEYPEYTKAIPKRQIAENEKIRIAFVSRHLFENSLNRTHGQWITKLNKKKFDISVFYLNHIQDEAVQEIQNVADSFYCFDTIEATRLLTETIANQHYDIIVYVDLGVYPVQKYLASLRLAPVQCTSLAHPLTSGLQHVDYFLSSELMERGNTEEQYSEKLIKLPNLSVSYPFPPVHLREYTERCKEARFNKIRYLNLQYLPKLLPGRDWVYTAIAKRVKDSEFHFIETQHMKIVNERFFSRLKKAFQKEGLQMEDYVVRHSYMKRFEFYGFIDFGDVILDSMDWSGFNTSMDASALDKPIVSLRGETCRALHSHGILKRLELDEVIAKDEDEFIEIAVKLGLDQEFREDVAKKVKARKDRLFEDEVPIRALEDFFARSMQS
jgi:protein O-GlcNAc transferase